MNSGKRKIKVLLADDDAKDHKNFEIALSNSEFPVQIESVYNGLKLIDYLVAESKKKNFIPDLIITDLYMPFAGGLQVLKQIRKNIDFKEVPIYVFSANFDATIQRNVLEYGATGFYRKPANIEDLKSLISGILQQYQPTYTS
jgi:CheY-like chemotaxis protein